MPTFWALFPEMHVNTLAMPLLLVSTLTAGDHTPNGPSLGGPYTGSIVDGTLLGSPGENVANLGTILPLS